MLGREDGAHPFQLAAAAGTGSGAAVLRAGFLACDFEMGFVRSRMRLNVSEKEVELNIYWHEMEERSVFRLL